MTAPDFPESAAAPPSGTAADGVVARMDLADLQASIERTYGDRDRARGVSATVAWLAEEIGELAQAVRKGTREEQLHELGDVLAWLASLAAQLDLSMSEAVQRYATGCPACGCEPCEVNSEDQIDVLVMALRERGPPS